MELDFSNDGFLFNFSFIIFGVSIILNTVVGYTNGGLKIFNLFAGSLVVLVSVYNLYKGDLDKKEYPRWASYVVLIGSILMLLSVAIQLIY